MHRTASEKRAKLAILGNLERGAVRPTVREGVYSGPRPGLHYFRSGLQVLRSSPRLYVQLVVLFAAPAVGAALLSVSTAGNDLSRATGTVVLDFFPAQVAPAVMMVAVAAGFAGRTLGVGDSLRQGLPWLPRYIWTNLHTSVVFWVPVGTLVALYQRRIGGLPEDGALGTAISATLIAAMIALGLYIQTRTLLASFLAVHENQPGTLSALNAWRMGGKHTGRILGTFVVAGLPVALPLFLLITGLLIAWQGMPEVQAVLLAMLPSLAWAAIQIVRPVMVPAVYSLYRDLWDDELARRSREGEPRNPAFVAPLLALSAWVPRFAGRLVGRRVEASL